MAKSVAELRRDAADSLALAQLKRDVAYKRMGLEVAETARRPRTGTRLRALPETSQRRVEAALKHAARRGILRARETSIVVDGVKLKFRFNPRTEGWKELKA